MATKYDRYYQRYQNAYIKRVLFDASYEYQKKKDDRCKREMSQIDVVVLRDIYGEEKIRGLITYAFVESCRFEFQNGYPTVMYQYFSLSYGTLNGSYHSNSLYDKKKTILADITDKKRISEIIKMAIKFLEGLLTIIKSDASSNADKDKIIRTYGDVPCIEMMIQNLRKM